MSDWEAPSLTKNQIRYAALDALLTGEVFRALRVLHAGHDVCAGCETPLFMDPGIYDLVCLAPECQHRRPFRDPMALLMHARQKGHPPPFAA